MGRPFAFSWLPVDGGTQQPTKSWCKRWITGGDDGGQGDNRGLGRYPIIWAIKFSGKINQNREMGEPLALDGRHSMEGHNNQPKVVGSNMMGPRGARCTASTSTAGRLRDGYFGQI